jgi:hypothetical protein
MAFAAEGAPTPNTVNSSVARTLSDRQRGREVDGGGPRPGELARISPRQQVRAKPPARNLAHDPPRRHNRCGRSHAPDALIAAGAMTPTRLRLWKR